jgi:hypothetical protein
MACTVKSKGLNMYLLKRLFRITGVVALAVAAFTVAYLAAQKNVFKTFQNSGVANANSSYSVADCKEYNLSSTAFMEAIKAVIQHGNLADVAFTEKELETKFSSQYFKGKNGQLDFKRSVYRTNNLLGSPINVVLDVPDQQSATLSYPWTGIVMFDGSNFPDRPGDFLADCVHLTVSEFSSYFGGDFSYSKSTGPVDPIDAGDGDIMMPFLSSSNLGDQKIGSSGLDGSKVYLEFSFGKANDLIYGIRIFQSR